MTTMLLDPKVIQLLADSHPNYKLDELHRSGTDLIAHIVDEEDSFIGIGKTPKAAILEALMQAGEAR